MEYNEPEFVNETADVEAEAPLSFAESEQEPEEIQFFAEEPEETVTDAEIDPYGATEADDAALFDSEDAEDGEATAGASVADELRARVQTLRENCRALTDRIVDDLKETNGNPYIRSTTTYRYEVLRNAKDTEPVDVFEFTRTSGASLRAMAITAAIVAAADVTVARIFKKKLIK